jgi:hypothetical protein
LKISNLYRIVQGNLLNTPSVQSVHLGHVDASKIKPGDFYIGDDSHEMAVQNGAYAIISTKIQNTLDNEIAWIEVTSIQKALFSLLRYRLSSSQIFLVPDIAFTILQMTTTKGFHTFFTNVTDEFAKLYKQPPAILFVQDQKSAQMLGCLQHSFPIDKESLNIIKQNPLYCSFCFEEQYFEDIHIASIFFDALLLSIHIATFFQIPFQLAKLSYFAPIEITYIDSKLNPLEFGKNDKIFIHIDDIHHYDAFIKQLLAHYKWSRFCIVDDETTLDDIKSAHFIISQKSLSIISQLFSKHRENDLYTTPTLF